MYFKYYQHKLKNMNKNSVKKIPVKGTGCKLVGNFVHIIHHLTLQNFEVEKS